MNYSKWAPKQLVEVDTNELNSWNLLWPKENKINKNYPQSTIEVRERLIFDERMEEFWELISKNVSDFETSDFPEKLMYLIIRIFSIGPYLVDSQNITKLKKHCSNIITSLRVLKASLKKAEEVNLECLFSDIYYRSPMLVIGEEPGRRDEFKHITLNRYLESSITSFDRLLKIKGFLGKEEKDPRQRMLKFFIRKIHQFFHLELEGPLDEWTVILVKVFLKLGEEVDRDYVRARRSGTVESYPRLEDELFLMNLRR